MGEEFFVRLRDCFTAGYTFPQYCIDNGIQKPLFVSEKRFELFLWEIYVQFRYDKRMYARFCFLNAENTKLDFAGTVPPLEILNVSSVNFDDFDKVILLTEEKVDIPDEKVIHFADLAKFFKKRTYVDIPLLSFLQRYPKVKLFLTNFPSSVKRYEGGMEFDSQLISSVRLEKMCRHNKRKNFETPFDKFGYNRNQIKKLVTFPKVKANPDGSTLMEDTNEVSLQRIKNGKRYTVCQPKCFRNRIYFFGTCHYYGVYAPFDKTIESYLQQMLNENNLPYRVENESQRYARRLQDTFYNLNKLNPMPGDIIFVCFNGNLRSNNDIIPFCDVSDAFEPPNDYREIFCAKKTCQRTWL